jgi:ATP-dependent DNA ligase
MTLPIRVPFAPMESILRAEIPEGSWQYEPKWDGFRCLAFKDGDDVQLQSKSGQPLARYFPEVIDAVRRLRTPKLVIDGELVIPVGDGVSFDDLLQRIHPAASRVAQLAQERPALLVAFDLLVDAHGRSLVDEPLRSRRRLLESLAARAFGRDAGIVLSPATTKVADAQRWFARSGGSLDGIVAKERDGHYRSGERAMVKVKHKRTADCVVGGFRLAAKGGGVGSLLLGLFEVDKLHHVGFTSSFRAAQRQELLQQLEPLRHGKGFSGRAPGGPSRWSTARSAEWEPLDPHLVVEVEYDHWSNGRFRHGTRLLRFRPDKHPRQCTLEQVEAESQIHLAALIPEAVAAG